MTDRDVTQLSYEYLAFLRQQLVNAWNDNSDESHIHPAPEWVMLYQNIIRNADSAVALGEDRLSISFDDLLMVADSIARFASYKAQIGEPYTESDSCDCFTLTDHDLLKLQEGVI